MVNTQDIRDSESPCGPLNVHHLGKKFLPAAKLIEERSAGIYDPNDPRDAHVLMPEYLTYENKSQQIAEHVVTWLTDE